MIQVDFDTAMETVKNNRERVKRQILLTKQADQSLLEEHEYLKGIGDKQSFSYLVSKAVVFYCAERKKKRDNENSRRAVYR